MTKIISGKGSHREVKPQLTFLETTTDGSKPCTSLIFSATSHTFPGPISVRPAPRNCFDFCDPQRDSHPAACSVLWVTLRGLPSSLTPSPDHTRPTPWLRPSPLLFFLPTSCLKWDVGFTKLLCVLGPWEWMRSFLHSIFFPTHTENILINKRSLFQLSPYRKIKVHGF